MQAHISCKRRKKKHLFVILPFIHEKEHNKLKLKIKNNQINAVLFVSIEEMKWHLDFGR